MEEHAINNETFDDLAEWSRHDAIHELRTFHEITIDLFAIVFADLVALQSLWKFIAPKPVSILAEAASDDNMTDEQMEVVAQMMRASPQSKKTIYIGSDFIANHRAALFSDVVFDKVVVHDCRTLHGADIPPCRFFRFENRVRRNVIISPTDALVPFIRKLEVSEDDADISTYRHLSPEKIMVFTTARSSLLERLSCMFPRVRKLELFLSDCLDNEVAMTVTRFRALDTLILLNSRGTNCVPRGFFRTIARHLLMRRVCILRSVDNLDFLLEMPKLEKFRYSPVDSQVDTAPFYMLPRLRSLVNNWHVDPSEEREFHARICTSRQCYFDDLLNLYRIVTRAVPPDSAQLICVMMTNENENAIALDIMRNPPERNTLDGRWELDYN